MNNVQFSNFMMMNNQNNQNNSNDFPDQSKVAQFFNQANNMNQNNMMNNNMNNNMNMMSNMNMNNNMGMNNNMNMNNMYMINNNMNNMGMNNMNNMNMYNMPNNNMGMNNFQMMNFNNMNNMHMMNNNMNNMGMNNMNMNNNMGMNNMNNMALVRRNSNGNNFQINWYGNNFLPNNMNSQNNLYVMKFLQNQMLQRQYYQMMFQQRMFYQMQRNILERNRKMSEILDRNFNNNNINNNIIEQVDINLPIVNRNNEQDFTPNQALLDVIQEPNPPQQNQNNNQNQNNPILPSDLVSEVIVNVMNLNPDLLSGLGNNLLGEWAQGENRGGRPYKPPNGWIGYGLNVLNKYDNGNNDWLACNGRPGEWCIAYHGACHGQSSDNVKKGIKSILETNLRPGGGQACRDHADLNHPGQKVGVGVYCSPDPSVIDGYAGIMNINGHNYMAGFMLRVKPDKIRISSSTQTYWVVNGDFSELRPYRLLIKPC